MIGSMKLKATKTLVAGGNSLATGKRSIDKEGPRPVFRPLFCLARVRRTPLPGSSVAEQVTVNHLVAGSIPARAAISSFCHEVTRDDRTRLKLSLSVTLTEATN